ncbi:RNA polymerase sigma factor [Clostridium aminobutyricum]|uniref:RNA polymerase sigma factor n=1 Tax=Clostridium aminobutyricum TaxID=33953 RepID=A0A939IH80_CLOAM|nr:RNA polymerase sigma factor [Clostridium aminobutyricum]MBN7773337.1 RNA polymerase sigma factor [Clostridium aminobutyricum]
MMNFLDDRQRSLFEEMYQVHKKTVYYIALKYLKNEQVAEEAVQEIFFKAFCHIEKFSSFEPYRAKGYLMQIAKNTSIDIYRKENNRWDVTNEEEIELLTIEDDFCLEKMIIKKEIARQLNLSLNDLKEIDKQILTLRYIEEKTIKEIAETVGLSYENTRTRIMRAKRKLANSLLEEKEDMLNEF